MLDTDIQTAQTPGGRPSAFGDLRFAGTVATGLVAGTLGLGALAAPLVGWRDWPSGLQTSAARATRRSRLRRRSSRRAPGPARAPATAAAPRRSPAAPRRWPASESPARPVAWRRRLGLGGISVTPAHRRRAAPGALGAAGDRRRVAELDLGDVRARRLHAAEHRRHRRRRHAGHLRAGPRVHGRRQRRRPTDNGGGMSRATEFQIRSEIANPDTNGDGVVDGTTTPTATASRTASRRPTAPARGARTPTETASRTARRT